ncbi:DsbA family protein [Paraneptunicella aestuarii]|uniref:DsbA family oxidoreductase n=1 Tax=Paraneptunicella aestuarii TaxID=2831148 RepID=UPI001E28CE49|nr:DsbA family protein [Paraneptunicella aestuarii]UAA37485.1 DsbA family protein [Paraneptunicella aestuarii]
MSKLTVEFFHDAVCGWCYVQSPRLRKIAQEMDIKVVQRCFVLQRNNQEIIQRFGSLEQAKTEILGHWVACKQHADDPTSIDIEGMAKQPFTYPSGYLAALGAKAAEMMGDSDKHWDFFDAIQNQHLRINNNIGDASILIETAQSIGLNPITFEEKLHSDEVKAAVEDDLLLARRYQIRSIPTLVINGEKVISQTLSLEQMRQVFSQLLAA